MPDDRIRDDTERPRRDDEERPRRAGWDDDEERPRGRRIRRDDGDDGGMNSLIPYKNPKALIAYYLGVFALIPCFGIPLGIGSIVMGVMGLKYRKTHATAGGTGHAWAGIILGSFSLLGHLAVVIFFVVAWNVR